MSMQPSETKPQSGALSGRSESSLLDFLKLHLVVWLWGFTAVLGNLIDLSATQVVFYRSTLATLILCAVLRERCRIAPKVVCQLVASGMLLGLHWVLFFTAVKMANVSICMVGMATVSFWTALLEPLLTRRRSFRWINFALGMVVIVAVYWIFQTEAEFQSGLFVALAGALVACVFSIVNGMLSSRTDNRVIVMYEMAGAALFCAAALVFPPWWGVSLASPRWVPDIWEWIWMAILVLVCTIYAYEMYVDLLRRLSVFTINFANNLEPVYGIVLGAIFFGDHQHFGPQFYIGAALVAVSVLVQPRLSGE